MVNPIHVLLIDDDVGDIELTRELIEQARLQVSFEAISDSQKAIDYLQKHSPFENAIRPDLILLDINMPRMNGHEVLAEIKKNNKLKSIPVVMLTTSGDNDDITKAYQNGANCYITKPTGLLKFKEVIKALDAFWLSVVKFPPRQ